MRVRYAVIAATVALFLTSCGSSNNGTPTSPDTTPPARVTDLAVVGATATSLTLQWTAPGDDGADGGKAASYTVRWSPNPINETNFKSATDVTGEPAPGAPGSTEMFTVDGLDSNLVYHFALRTRDDANNPSLVSNDAMWKPAGPLHFSKVIPSFKDNTIYAESDTLSNGIGQHIYAGNTNFLNNPRRALLAFAVADSIPAGAVIDSVALTLNESKVSPTGNTFVVSLKLLTADWGEGTSLGNVGHEGAGTGATAGDATWYHRFVPNDLWTTAGGDFVAGVSASVVTARTLGSYTWKSAQMTTDVQGWLDVPATNFGWILIGDETANGSARQFDSRENTVAANRPKLTVYYTINP